MDIRSAKPGPIGPETIPGRKTPLPRALEEAPLIETPPPLGQTAPPLRRSPSSPFPPTKTLLPPKLYQEFITLRRLANSIYKERFVTPDRVDNKHPLFVTIPDASLHAFAGQIARPLLKTLKAQEHILRKLLPWPSSAPYPVEHSYHSSPRRITQRQAAYSICGPSESFSKFRSECGCGISHDIAQIPGIRGDTEPWTPQSSVEGRDTLPMREEMGEDWDKELESAGIELERALNGRLTEYTKDGMDAARRQEGEAIVKVNWKIKMKEAEAFLGEYSVLLSTYLTSQARWELTQTILKGIQSGKGAADIAKDIGKLSDDYAGKRSLLIARTEGMRAMNNGRQGALMAMGFDEYVIVASSLACPVCIEWEGNGAVYKAHELPMLPIHPNCRCTLAAVTPMTPRKDDGGVDWGRWE